MKKILVFVAYLLALAYAVDREKVKEVYDHIENCVQELNKPQNDVDVLYCAIQKEGLLDENGKYLLDKGLALVVDIISDEAKQNEAKELVRKCYDEAGYDTPGDIREKTIKGIQCGVTMLSLIDKI